MSSHSSTTGTKADGFRRLEVITGVGRRRRWTDEEKARVGAESLEPELQGGPLRTLRKVWADLAFAGERAAAPLARHGIELELVGRKSKGGFAVEPRRWKVEQTFGCLTRYRRLQVDHEGGTGMSRIMTLLASLFMAGARFERQTMS